MAIRKAGETPKALAKQGKSGHVTNKRRIESYEHRDKKRVNNPPVGLVTPETDPDAGQKKKTYAYDPHLIRPNQLDTLVI